MVEENSGDAHCAAGVDPDLDREVDKESVNKVYGQNCCAS